MWLVVMFDLPTDTSKAKKAYVDFRKILKKDGFMMMQYSVYIRHCSSDENARVHAERIKIHLPPDGEVRILLITDKQFSRMQVFFGTIRGKTEHPPSQLTLF